MTDKNAFEQLKQWIEAYKFTIFGYDKIDEVDFEALMHEIDMFAKEFTAKEN